MRESTANIDNSKANIQRSESGIPSIRGLKVPSPIADRSQSRMKLLYCLSIGAKRGIFETEAYRTLIALEIGYGVLQNQSAEPADQKFNTSLQSIE